MKPESWTRVKELFATLRELSPAEQSQRLDTLCTDDPEVRAEVVRMLKHASPPEQGDPTPPRDPYQAAGPQRIGPFDILEHIGSGAAGMVYRARDPVTKQQLAVKVLRLAIDSEKSRRRIECEGEILARFGHPGIARIHQVGTTTTEFGTLPYIAMEFVEGDPIDTYATTKNLDDRARVALMAKVCDAVAYAHHRGVIHRDLKPANILVDQTGNPRLLDFGIAKSTEETLDFDTLSTRAGDILGTPGYMSPEQATGNAANADTRADVYALGVILYELLTRQRLSNCSDMPLLAALEALESKDPPLVSTACPHLKGPLESIITKAMDRNPRRRYDTAAAFAEDLHRYLRGTEVLAEPVTDLYKCRRYIRRHRSVIAIALATVGLLTIGIVFQWRVNIQNTSNNNALQYIIRITSDRNPVRMKKDFIRLLDEYPNTTLDTGTVQIAFDVIGGKMHNIAERELAAKSYEIAFDATRQMLGSKDLRTLRALQVYAEALNMSGQAAQALELLNEQRAIQNFDPEADAEKLYKTRLLRLAMTYAETKARLGEPQWAFDYLEQVLAAQIQACQTEPGKREHTDITDTRDMMRDIERIYKLPVSTPDP